MLFVGVLFILLRQIERWLHQHIFKVGWLLSHNYETTTILYYTIFLPGVLLHEIVYWLMAGVLNVRADRAIQWPEKQEIGNLQLNFIKLSPKANPLKKAVIAATPLIAGLLAIWIIAVNIFQLEAVMSIASSGHLEDIASAISVLTSTPDFWLWFYISFTIANTMFPTIPKDMKGWWQIGGALIVILIALIILGIGQNILGDLTLSLGQIINSLSLILILTITINITMVMLLGAIESAIERITGHSATFQKGKMITMTREEVLKLKQEQEEKRLATRSSPRRKTASANPASIYALEFPIPGPPGQEPITKGVAAVLGMEAVNDLPDTTEEEDVFETTATDSTRQRMLKLFGETANETTKSAAEGMPALPDKTSSKIAPPLTSNADDIPEPPKPKADIQAFSKPKINVSEKPNAPHIDDDESIKRATGKLGKDAQGDDRKKDANIEKDTEKSTQSPLLSNPKPTISPPAIIPKSADKESKEDSKEKDTPALSAQRSNINLPSKPLDIADTKDDEQLSARPQRKKSIFDDIAKIESSTNDGEETETKDSPLSTPALRSKINPPTISPKSVSTVDGSEDDEEDDEQLSTRLPRRSSIFDDIAKPTPSTTDSEAEAIEKPTPLTTGFSRPFAQRKVVDNDEEEEEDTDEESIIIPSSQFQRPFAPPTKSDDSTKKPTPSWRSQLTATSKSTDEDDDEDDEQLSTRTPRRSSMFDSLNAPSKDSDSKSIDSTPSWRSQLTATTKSTDEDDEQLSRRGSLLKGLGRPQPQKPKSTIKGSASRPAPKPTQQPSNDWRSQFSSDDDDEADTDDEELNYEPIDDEIIYDDDDYLDYDDD